MKISEIFALNKQQHELDFINIDIDKEIPLFLDAYIFSVRDDVWAKECNILIEDFFRKIHEYIKLGRKKELYKLCSPLSEPNETCLGRSKGKPRGTFQSTEKVVEIFYKLYDIQHQHGNQFDVIKTLSDMKFYIEDVGNDTVSDIITNLIRFQLLEYTYEQCRLHNIPTEKMVSKPFWNGITSRWEKMEDINQLIIGEKRILLVPKNTVFSEGEYTFEKDVFVQHDMLNFLTQQELQIPSSSLIKHRQPKKDQEIGDPYVTKKSIRERDRVDRKEFVLEFSSKYPEIMDAFKKKKHFKSLDIEKLYEFQNEKLTDDDYNELIDAFILTLKSIPSGKSNAYEYHKFISGLLTFMFYPSLSNPKEETPIDSDRKG
ncbi:Uncharacterised protein [Enterococcus casseliflavus]|uniref:Uncharacterized protein n=1 Tax=Enterococcus casseliflavus TaxID=37734 RepID=A0A6N2Y958_ENTCA